MEQKAFQKGKQQNQDISECCALAGKEKVTSTPATAVGWKWCWSRATEVATRLNTNTLNPLAAIEGTPVSMPPY